MKFVVLADRDIVYTFSIMDSQEVFGKKRFVSRLNERFQVKNQILSGLMVILCTF